VSLSSGPTERLITPLSALNKSFVPDEDIPLLRPHSTFLCLDGSLIISPNKNTIYTLDLEPALLRTNTVNPGPPYLAACKLAECLVLLSPGGVLQILSAGKQQSIFELPPEPTWSGLFTTGEWLVLWASETDSLCLQALQLTFDGDDGPDLVYGHEAQLSICPGESVQGAECMVLANGTSIVLFTTSQGRVIVFTVDRSADIRHQFSERVATGPLLPPVSISTRSIAIASEVPHSSLLIFTLRNPY